MLTFSITAPMLSDEDDRKEHESLSPQEKEAIENDVFGKDGFVETPAMIHQGLVQMSEAIAAIAPEEKQAYLRALKVAPELVANESKMLYFLRAERFNYWSSAERFVAYWEARSQWFGENAFRPMTCTEQGALSEDAMRLLSKAMWVKGGTDDKGRVVVLFNRSLLERSRQFRTAALQVILYTLTSIISESEDAQRNGIVIVVNCEQNMANKFDRKLCRDTIRLLNDALPLKIKVWHVCIPYRRPPFNYTLAIIRYIVGKQTRRRFILHSGSLRELQESLAEYGIDTRLLPESMGGEWDAASTHAAWLEARLALES